MKVLNGERTNGMSPSNDLIPVHGGLDEPVDRVVALNERSAFRASASALPILQVTNADLSTVYRLADGALSPLEGPMRADEWNRVLDDEVARLEKYVFVPMDLNAASSEDFLTIPGVGNRMVHEFEEYRPYVNMAQFEREIGKYVDENEVARLARYVYIEQ